MSNSTARRPRRGGGSRRGNSGRRTGGAGRNRGASRGKQPAKRTFWQKLVAIFTGGANAGAKSGGKKRRQPAGESDRRRQGGARSAKSGGGERIVAVTGSRLYVGNLSYDATESDLFELFNGVGTVQNAEVVTHRRSQRSKGFAFVEVQTVDEAKRAVEVLHDQEFFGRKLVVSGAKSDPAKAA